MGYAYLFHQTEDVIDNKRKLLVSVDYFQISVLIFEKVNQPISIAVEGRALLSFEFGRIITRREFLLFVHILSTAAVVQEGNIRLMISKLYSKVFRNFSLEFFKNWSTDSVRAVQPQVALVVRLVFTFDKFLEAQISA